ncbi:hypothetical protein [Microbacterium algeriense]|uniref:Uncharacterized protein n=1 Tax=Microbacterium algeriense TaxID=2615184 RepID=A0ABQ6V6N4_9MICO|nr:hypothetical protein [Microbacterium algeriense]KAB1865018.1 hypothetical protein F6A08_13280 [Microbacterium algeriense]
MSTDLPETDPEDQVFSDDDGVLYDEEVTPEYGILGFTLRELLIVAVWLVSFVVSFFPFAGDVSLWGVGIQWILPIGLPTVAVFLLVLRRFSPDGIRRVGSLGIDQFASVAFSVAAVVWAGNLWLAISGMISGGFWALPWNGVVMSIASLALVVLTVFAPIIPGLKEDFQGRLVTLAHRNANPVRPVIARPRPESESASASAAVPSEESEVEITSDERLHTDEVHRLDLAEQVPLSAHASGGGTGTEQTTADEEYRPTYARRSRAAEPEIVSDTGSIESLLQTAARVETGDVYAAENTPVSAAPASGTPDAVDRDGADSDTAGFDAPEYDAPAPETRAFDTTVLDDATPSGDRSGAVDDGADVEATNPREAAPAAQPFWILAPTERDVHDERGEPIFRVGPTAWALVIEDRGGAYVVRHDDGRIGYLHEISDITKG